MIPTIYITEKKKKNGITILSKHFKLIYNNTDRTLSKDELIAGIKHADILLCLLKDKIDKDVIDANPQLKGICNYAVGYNNIDVEYATKKKIPVTNTPDVLTETTADLSWALLMATARRLVEADNFVRKNKFKGWHATLFTGKDIYKKTLGIIGAGRIGTAVAKRSVGFDMKILYYSRNKNNFLEDNLKAQKTDLHTLLKNSDFISIHLPLTDLTYHLIDKNEFDIMKSEAILINTARGAVVNEKELINALKNKKITAAGLDVYEFEPKITKELLTLTNTVLLPHIGSASIETRENMAKLTADAAISIMQGKIPENTVNKDFLI